MSHPLLERKERYYDIEDNKMPPSASGNANGIIRLTIRVAMLIFYTIGTSAATLYYVRSRYPLTHSSPVWQSKYGCKHDFYSELLTTST